MSLLSMEHSSVAYRLDFALYTLLCAANATALMSFHPAGSAWELLLWVVGGGVLWSLLEYLLHRFVLHGVAPFSNWHGLHHQRPAALIASPIALSLSLFLLLATLPAWWLTGGWHALALTLGLMSGYLVYSVAHHATHHRTPVWISNNAWITQCRIRHAMHHSAHHLKARGAMSKPCHFGVSNSLWDEVFGTRE